MNDIVELTIGKRTYFRLNNGWHSRARYSQDELVPVTDEVQDLVYAIANDRGLIRLPSSRINEL